MIFLLTLLVFVGLMLFFTALTAESREAKPGGAAARLQKISAGAVPSTYEEIIATEPASTRLLKPLLRRLTRVVLTILPNTDPDRVAVRLEAAGLFGAVREMSGKRSTPPDEYIGMTMLSAFVIGALGIALLIQTNQPLQFLIGGAIAAAIIGFKLPDFVLSQQAKTRRKLMKDSIPDFLDLLTICLAAGEGFDAALLRTIRQTKGPLADEFKRVYLEVTTTGRDRRAVWEEARDRVKVDSVGAFISAYLLSLGQGGSVRSILNEQANLLRVKRLQAAEKAGAQAIFKMAPAIVGFFLPAFMLLLLGPAIVQVAGGGF